MTITTKTPWHLVATMQHPDSHNLARTSLGLGKVLLALFLLGTALPIEPLNAQVAGAARRTAARAAASAAERGALVRAVKTPQVLKRSCSATKNKCASLPREAAARRVLAHKYPNERIQPEAYLRNRNGTKAIDPKTGKGRRVDFVLISREGYTRRFEVTSQTADKRAQIAKEQRIFARRGNGRARTGPLYVRDKSTGKLVPTKPGPSKIMRFQ